MKRLVFTILAVFSLILFPLSNATASTVGNDTRFEVKNETVQTLKIENGELTITTKYYGDVSVQDFIEHQEKEGRHYTKVQNWGDISTMANFSLSADFYSVHRDKVVITTIGSGEMNTTPINFNVSGYIASVMGPNVNVTGITDMKLKNRLQLDVVGFAPGTGGGGLFTATYDYSGPEVSVTSLPTLWDFDEGGVANIWAFTAKMGADFSYKDKGYSYSGTHWQQAN